MRPVVKGAPKSASFISKKGVPKKGTRQLTDFSNPLFRVISHQFHFSVSEAHCVGHANPPKDFEHCSYVLEDLIIRFKPLSSRSERSSLEFFQRLLLLFSCVVYLLYLICCEYTFSTKQPRLGIFQKLFSLRHMKFLTPYSHSARQF